MKTYSLNENLVSLPSHQTLFISLYTNLNNGWRTPKCITGLLEIFFIIFRLSEFPIIVGDIIMLLLYFFKENF